MKQDIIDHSAIKLLVDRFYQKVREDDLLRTIFAEKIRDQWPLHQEKMYSFWQTVLLNDHSYSGRPFAPHLNLPVGKPHFDKWLELFYATIDENFYGKKAEEAKWRAGKMAELFYSKILYHQNNPGKFLL